MLHESGDFRRLLEEQIAVLIVLASGRKDDAMWHVPQFAFIITSKEFQLK